ncbi:NERD domain-containing protein [uncultured Sphaerochaeta sp.]|uniref:NERD domain-containing protein n=1 Tax=uncultured Sphaerochaeta sp. TaxID=886478 RepID=UPI002A0A9311|nr:NERD domain-containing protein [uncultured Sphaerochaeta sp.]
MVILFVIILAIIVLAYRYDRINIKGIAGESNIARKLQKIQNEKFMVLNDVLLKTQKGSSQIDHVVISIYGIFVIETKNYSGWIHGNENSEFWTQSIYKNKIKFRNPIKQNWAHVYALKEVLSDFKQISYHPIVVFSGRAVLKNINSRIPVIYSNQLISMIIEKQRAPNLSKKQIKFIANKLRTVSIQGGKARKIHVDQVNAQIRERRLKEKSLVCPRCGGILIIRNGQYGKFYGCANYPECRYTKTYKT